MIDQLLTTASVAETAYIADNVASEVIDATIADDYLNGEAQLLKTDAEDMSGGMGTDRKKDHTDELFESDGKRDNYLTALNFFLKGFITWNKPETAPAAVLLSNAIHAYGKGVARLTYEKETGVVDSILLKLNEPEMIAALTTLNLGDLKQDLTGIQSTFKSLYKQSAASESAKADNVVPSNVKLDVQKRLNVITAYLNSMSLAKKEVYGTLAETIAETIDTLNGKIRNRYGSTGNNNGSTPNLSE